MESIKRKVKEIIAQFIQTGVKPEDITDTAYLLSGGMGMDSISLIEIFVKLEEEFDIFFEDFELSEENMVTVNVIADLVHKKIEEKA